MASERFGAGVTLPTGHPAEPLGLVGLGLIGSSIARMWSGSVLAFDPELSTVDLPDVALAPLSEVAQTKLLVLAAPTSANPAYVAQLAELNSPAIVLDVGAVKSDIQQVWLDNPALDFVGTHPMAGLAKAGWQAGNAELFRGAPWAVVVHENTSDRALNAAAGLIWQAGARVVPVSAAAHDDAIARVSHVPHLIAAALAKLVAAAPNPELTATLAGGSFADITRVNQSPAARTADFIWANRAAAAPANDFLAQILNDVPWSDRESLRAWFESSGSVQPEIGEPVDGAPAALLRDLVDSGASLAKNGEQIVVGRAHG